MKMRDIINIMEKGEFPAIYHAKWNPENMWFDIVDNDDNVVVQDVSPNQDQAEELAARYHPGMIIEDSDIERDALS